MREDITPLLHPTRSTFAAPVRPRMIVIAAWICSAQK